MLWKLSMPRFASVPRIGAAAIAVVAAAVFCSLELTGKPPGLLQNPPELRAKHQALSLTLHAAIASDGKNSFYFDGQPNAPTLRLSPGDQLKITYINDLPTKAKESCAITPCMDMTNLHFHGLTVSPDAPQDDGHYGLHRPRNQGHVRLSLPSPQSRRQGDDGEDSL